MIYADETTGTTEELIFWGAQVLKQILIDCLDKMPPDVAPED